MLVTAQSAPDRLVRVKVSGGLPWRIYMKQVTTVALGIILIFVCLTGFSSCKAKPVIPCKIWTGKAGETPTEVWQHYDWIIKAQEVENR